MHQDIHEVQATILKELLLNNGTNFVSLNKLGLENDHFTFHIKKLVSEGLIEKRTKLYFLTQKGKEICSKLDIEFLKFERQGGPSVVVSAKKVINGTIHYLVHQRLKEPFWGDFGYVNGKIRFGESTLEAAKREFLEETGLTGEFRNLGVQHKITGPSKDKIILDNFFFWYLVENPQGKLTDTRGGKNFWKTKQEILNLKLIPGLKSSIKIMFEEKYIPYSEEYVKLEEI